MLAVSCREARFYCCLLVFWSLFHRKPPLSRVRPVEILRLPLTLQKTLENKWFFNIFAFWSHQARTCMHHACRLLSRSSFFSFFARFLLAFPPKTTFFISFSTEDHILPIHKASKPQSLEVPRRESRSENNFCRLSISAKFRY